MSKPVSGYALDEDFGGRVTFVKDVWPTYLTYRALPAAYHDMGRIADVFRSRHWGGRMVYVLLQILIIPFYLLKFISAFLVESAVAT